MPTFLAWLYSVATRVYSFFGDQFYILYAGALNAWSWASTQATLAYNNARAYAYSLYNGIQNSISGLSNWTEYQLGLLWDRVNAVSSVTYNQVIGWITAQLSPVWNAVNLLTSQLSSITSGLWEQLTAWVRDRIADALRNVTAVYGWVNAVRDRLTAIVTALTNNLLTTIVTFFTSTASKVIEFMRDPETWLYDLLEAKILAFLSWVIGWAMGAVDDDLPTVPPWRR